MTETHFVSGGRSAGSRGAPRAMTRCTGRDVAPARAFRARCVTLKASCVSAGTSGDRESYTAPRGLMAVGASCLRSRRSCRVARVIEPHSETLQRRKRFYSVGLRVRVADRANGAARVCEPLRMAPGAGRVTRKAWPRRVVLTTMTNQARKRGMCRCVREFGKVSACFARRGRWRRDFRAGNNRQNRAEHREHNDKQNKPATPLARRRMIVGTYDLLIHFRRVAHIELLLIIFPSASVMPSGGFPGSALCQKRYGTSHIGKPGPLSSSQSQSSTRLRQRSLRCGRYRRL